MTREEMIKRSFRPYMIITYNDRHGDKDMILVSADFENEVFTLRPLDIDRYEDEDFQVSISKVSFKKKEKSLKIIK